MKEIVKIWLESAYGVFPGAGGVKNTGYVVVELNKANSYTVRPKPIQKTIRTSSGLNRVSKLFSSQTGLSGNLSTYLYAEQSAFFLNGLLNISGGDLPSYTIDHYILREDTSGTVDYTRHLGVKFGSGSLTCSSDDPIAKLSFGVIGQKPVGITATDFPVPIGTEFPNSRPYLHTDLGTGGLILGGSRNNYSSFTFECKNILDTPFFESQYIGRNVFRGRDISLNAEMLYQVSSDRAAFESTTQQTASAVFNGTPTTTFNLGVASYLTAVEDGLDFGKVYRQTLSYVNTIDLLGTGTDFSYTVV